MTCIKRIWTVVMLSMQERFSVSRYQRTSYEINTVSILLKFYIGYILIPFLRWWWNHLLVTDPLNKCLYNKRISSVHVKFKTKCEFFLATLINSLMYRFYINFCNFPKSYHYSGNDLYSEIRNLRFSQISSLSGLKLTYCECRLRIYSIVISNIVRLEHIYSAFLTVKDDTGDKMVVMVMVEYNMMTLITRY